MKKVIAVAALVAGVLGAQPGWAVEKKAPCYSQTAIEAEQAIRYITDLMIASSACKNTTYAEFRLRNKDAIISYQKAMIAHLRGAPAFDKWNTAIANIAAQKQANVNLGVFCHQAESMLKHAGTLDDKAFRAYALAQAAAADGQYEKCAAAKKK